MSGRAHEREGPQEWGPTEWETPIAAEPHIDAAPRPVRGAALTGAAPLEGRCPAAGR
ncbi:hypothetical protein [Streptomyces ipomoeae]|uniref:hypothetical protein n=1 Tax=Streptomyces ipomoeae TaxID=103232 RepID=UPI0015EFE45A|nr:hypothetical protein [Streptomyces ipomoeae]MDX2931547.1 hypothetical protein [Streptomyces ipomoeae]